MIAQLGQVMLYVDDQQAAKNFWVEKLGFHLLSEVQLDADMVAIEVAPTKNSQTSLVLHDRAVVREINSDMNLETPSLMFYAEDLNKLYEEFQIMGIATGEMVELPQGRVFNFRDEEGNYFAVAQQ